MILPPPVNRSSPSAAAAALAEAIAIPASSRMPELDTPAPPPDQLAPIAEIKLATGAAPLQLAPSAVIVFIMSVIFDQAPPAERLKEVTVTVCPAANTGLSRVMAPPPPVSVTSPWTWQIDP